MRPTEAKWDAWKLAEALTRVRLGEQGNGRQPSEPAIVGVTLAALDAAIEAERPCTRLNAGCVFTPDVARGVASVATIINTCIALGW